MPIPLNEVVPGYYVARREDAPEVEFLVVAWGISPFMQIYALATDLSERPNFTDVKANGLEFLVRLLEPKELSQVVAKARA